jgi:hypothetical protein
MAVEKRNPKISDADLKSLASYIKPVARFANFYKGKLSYSGKGDLMPYAAGQLYYIGEVPLRDYAFTCSPKPVSPADDLEFLDAIATFHTWGAPVFFKPTVAEVLAQIPEKRKKAAAAFETVTEGLNSSNCMPEGFHHALTRLYKKKAR